MRLALVAPSSDWLIEKCYYNSSSDSIVSCILRYYSFTDPNNSTNDQRPTVQRKCYEVPSTWEPENSAWASGRHCCCDSRLGWQHRWSRVLTPLLERLGELCPPQRPLLVNNSEKENWSAGERKRKCGALSFPSRLPFLSTQPPRGLSPLQRPPTVLLEPLRRRELGERKHRG